MVRSVFLLLSVVYRAFAADSSAHVADFIAAGIGGLSVDGASSSAQSTTSPSSNAAFQSPISSRAPYLNTTARARVSVRSSLVPSISASTTAIAVTGDCYASWNAYWSASHLSSAVSVSNLINNRPRSSPTATITRTATITSTGYPGRTITFGGQSEITQFVVNGGFTISTIISPGTVPAETDTITAVSDVVSTGVITEILYTTIYPANVSLPPVPTCSLPPVVPDCQSSWEKWITTQLAPSPTPPPHCDIGAGFLNNRTIPPCVAPYTSAELSYASYANVTSPTCQAASIGGTLCQSVRDAYQLNDVFTPTIPNFEAWYFSQGTIGGYGTSAIGLLQWTWPTASTLGKASSCTLGCGRCGITGGTVQFLYWPTATPTPSAGNHTVSRSRPSENKAVVTAPPKTVVTLGTTLTSPTVYISYSNVYAANACGTVGTEIGSTILAIPHVSELSSVYAVTIPCDAHFRPTQVVTYTAPFTVEDLNEPVAASIYSSQPICQTYLRNHGCGGGCPSTAPYKPIIVVPNSILTALQPAWSNCWGDIRGVYDPPVALTAVSGADVPTVGVTSVTPVQALSDVFTSTIVSVVPVAKATGSNGDPQSQSAAAASTSVSNVATATGITRPDPDPSPSTARVQSGSDIDPTQNVASFGAGQGSAAKATTTLPLPSQDTPQVATLGSQVFTVAHGSTSGVVVVNGGATLSIGDTTTMSGQSLSLASTGLVVVGPTRVAQDPITTTVLLPGAGSTQVATIGPQLLTLSSGPTSGAIVVNGNGATAVLTVGGSTTLGDQTLSLGPTGLVVIGQTSTPVLLAGPAPTVIGTGSTAVTVSELPGGTSAVIAVGGSSTTVSAGASAITINGQIINVGSSGIIVLGGSSVPTTITAPTQGAPGAIPTIVTIGSQVVTMRELSGGSSVILAENGITTTMSRGSTATFGGQQVIVGSNGSVVFGTGSSARTLIAPTAIVSTTTSAITSGPLLYKSAASALFARALVTGLVPVVLLLVVLI